MKIEWNQPELKIYNAELETENNGGDGGDGGTVTGFNAS